MKSILQLTIFSALIVSNSIAFSAVYNGSNALDVWNTLEKSPYKELPTRTVGFFDLFDGLKNLIERDANRTLNKNEDILPEFKKLAHPNGVCLKGVWNITEENPYSGLFRKNQSAIIIARASTALSETTKDHLRGFGLAGKLFPTLNENEIVKTANFFLIDDLGGTKAAHYTDVEMTNEPKVSKTIAVLANIQYALTLAATFGKVDANPGIRQVYEIAESTKLEDEKIVSPKWMMVKSSAKQFKVNAADFRDELAQTLNRGNLLMDIYVANKETSKGKNWKIIGQIKFTNSIASNACDTKLHFHHPKWRSDLE
jgi:hypothetical protein